MKKYLYILKMEVISNLQYIFNIAIDFIGIGVILYIFLNLWGYLYADSNELINGYSMNQMVWYVIITEILWSILSGRRLCKRICNDVRSGNITYLLNKPYNYIGYVISSHFGLCMVRSVAYVIIAFILGYIFLGSFPNLNVISILLVFLTGILSTIISILIITCIGILSFFIEDANPLYWLYSRLILVIGVIFPIEFFPESIQGIIKYSPIYVVSYGPAKLFVDFDYGTFIMVFIAQLVYIFITYTICILIYRKGVKRINVNGG